MTAFFKRPVNSSISLCIFLAMALCAFSFPAHINRAAASDPQKSTSFASHLLGGTDLLFQPLHKLNQVCNVKMEVHLSFM